MYLFELEFSPDICLGVGLQDHMATSIFSFLRNLHTVFPWWLNKFTFPFVREGSFFSTPSPAFVICWLFNDGHSDQCEVVSHCSFDLHFSNN